MSKLQDIIDLHERGYHATAVRRLRDYLREHPDEAEGWYYLARYQTHPRQQKAAIDRALKLRPDYPEATEFQAVLLEEYPYLNRNRRRRTALLLAVVAALGMLAFSGVLLVMQDEPQEVVVVVPTTVEPSPITPTFIIVTNTPTPLPPPPTLLQDTPIPPTFTPEGVVILSPEPSQIPTIEDAQSIVPAANSERLVLARLANDPGGLTENLAAALSSDQVVFEIIETPLVSSAEAAALLDNEQASLVIYGAVNGDVVTLNAYGQDRDGLFRHRSELRYLSRLPSPWQYSLDLTTAEVGDANQVAPLGGIAAYVTYDYRGVIDYLGARFAKPTPGVDQILLGAMLAYSYQALGQSSAALDVYDFITTLMVSPDPHLVANRAYAIAQTGDPQAAISLLLDLVSSHPDPAFIQTLIGGIYASTPDGIDAAQLTLDGAIRQYPSDPRPYVERGDLFVRQNEFNRALEDYSQALAVDPGYTLAYFQRATLRVTLGLLDEALQDIDLAITFQPQIAQYYVLRGEILNEQGNWQDASTAFETAIQQGAVTAPAYAGLARAYYELGNLDGTIRESNNALTLDQNNIQAWLQRGRASLAQNQLDAALNDFNQGLARDGQSVDLLVARCTVHARLGDDGSAALDCDSALALDGQNGFALEQRGMIRARAGDRAGAAEDFAEAIAYEPTTYEAHYYLGLYALQEQRYNDAVRFLSRSIEIAPFLGKAYAARGVAYRITGQWELAISDLERALDLVPEDVYSYYELGLSQRFLADQAYEGGDSVRAYDLYEVAADSLLAFLNASQPEDPFVNEARAALGYVRDALNAIRQSP